MSRQRKAAPAEPCQHWAIDLMGRSCNDCGRTVTLPGDAAAKAQADRDAHNVRVIENMHQDILPGMAGEEN